MTTAEIRLEKAKLEYNYRHHAYQRLLKSEGSVTEAELEEAKYLEERARLDVELVKATQAELNATDLH